MEGFDYKDSFSPVAKSLIVQLVIAVTASLGWAVHQLDINNAFLHDYLNEDIYIVPPEEYNVPPGKVCKLNISLYGLKQASQQRNEEFTSKLAAFGFRQSKNDYCLFTKGLGTTFLALLVYVCGQCFDHRPSKTLITEVKEYRDGLFTIKNLGYAKYFLGIEIARSE
ncbi:UNVERIFIED_CONTAM: hypothetical protein Slati_2489300 [Sesamum latifolium]|uniref:Reverse transcriptase Ty1/copia-type domain-containing protein n=1 Tax=Sesamum latifolium TaxID=2727402 RepID=A0AAW2WF63_9LAMI